MLFTDDLALICWKELFMKLQQILHCTCVGGFFGGVCHLLHSFLSCLHWKHTTAAYSDWPQEKKLLHNILLWKTLTHNENSSSKCFKLLRKVFNLSNWSFSFSTRLHNDLVLSSSFSSVPAVSVTPFAAEWLVPFRLSKDFLNEAMAPVFVPAASTHPSEPTGSGAAV